MMSATVIWVAALAKREAAFGAPCDRDDPGVPQLTQDVSRKFSGMPWALAIR